VRHLDRHAAALAADPERQVVRIRLRPLVGADGVPVKRQHGRRPGVRNGTAGTVTIYVSADELATLPVTLRQ
jgi:hypothetical protein